MTKHEMSKDRDRSQEGTQSCHPDDCQCASERRQARRERKQEHRHYENEEREHKQRHKRRFDTGNDREPQSLTESTSAAYGGEVATVCKHFQTRIAAIQTQIDALEAAEPNVVKSSEANLADLSQVATSLKRNGAYEKVLDLALEHVTDVIMHEQALYDELEERWAKAGWSHKEVVRRYVGQFVAMVKQYDTMHYTLLQDVSPDDVRRITDEIEYIEHRAQAEYSDST